MEAALSNYDSLSALVHHLETELKSEILSAAELRARMANEWVSVEERLPDAEKEVRLFCVTPNGYTHWMPLPEPPGIGGVRMDVKEAITQLTGLKEYCEGMADATNLKLCFDLMFRRLIWQSPPCPRRTSR